MLLELHIREFAIIDYLDLKFDSGFIAFTGETGAGKSIIIDAVEMLLGGRADSTVVRTGAEGAIVEGTFRLDRRTQDALLPILEREGLLDEPEYLTLGREIRREGRNTHRVNGRSVNLGLLRELGEGLIDVHGQSEHLSLLRVREHLNLLDRFAQVEAARAGFAERYSALRRTQDELEDLRRRERDAARRTELLTFQLAEIEAAAPRLGEEAELLEERNRLANAEQLAILAEEGSAALDEGPGDSPSAADLLGQAAEALANLAKIDPGMESVEVEAQALVEQAGDLGKRLRVYREEIEFNPRRLAQVEERVDLIRSLKRKYGGSLEAVLAQAETARGELETITHAEERTVALEDEESRLLKLLAEEALALSGSRGRAAEQLGAAIEAELADLHMEGARFGVDARWEESPDGLELEGKRVAFDSSGVDQVEFLVAPNPGEGLKPLVKIASGGETSRLMLGLKGVLARADETPTLIFDEIDQGIGGRVGAIVGRKLWGLGRDHQVLCVTHLPQLAAFSDQHFRVEKHVDGGRTVTRVRQLEDHARIPELAEMLGGLTQANQESAAELIRMAEQEKTVV
ncbi:MAG TPA: DNA repair protein RecN [Anaerolineales bacterium]|jgi:DNA repair protein RecN (Recombination protein N)|nr:DNA repair protein RecN [Anaerolineales bacterium]